MTATAQTRKTDTGIFTAVLTLDGMQKDLAFATAQANRKSQAFSSNGHVIDFSFSDQTSGYLVETGNSTTFDQAQKTFSIDLAGATNVDVSVKAGIYDLTQANAWLFCFFCNPNGLIIRKQRIEFNDGYAKESVQAPTGAVNMCFAVRLDGAGTLGDLRLGVTRSQQKAKPKPSYVFDVAPKAATKVTPKAIATPSKNGGSAAKIAECVMGRDFEKGISLYGEIQAPNDNDRKQLIRCYASQHQFEKVVAGFEGLSPSAQSNPGTQLYYMRALGNLGLVKQAEKFITSICMNVIMDDKNFESLITVYPFAVYISETLANLVLAKILAFEDSWPKKSLNHLLRCTHDLINAGRYEDFFKLANKFHTFELGKPERAKMQILEAHMAYKLGFYDLQLERVNNVFDAFHAMKIAMPEDNQCISLDKVYCPDNAPKSKNGPLVSILMTSFNSAKTVEYAIRSLLNQTYADLEIIVIDDASTDDSCAVIRELCAQDARVSLIALDKNGGTYVAKNHGLKQAQGQFVTCQDSDDWAHPQKIERLVDTLMQDDRHIGAAVQHIRYDPKRGFRGLGGYIRPDASSLMYRREKTLNSIGFYDSVRVGGDSEFQFRIERMFGRTAIKQLPDLLSLVLWSETSLSGGGKFAIDDDAGIFTPFRNAYRTAFCSWQENADSLRVPFPLAERHFEVSNEGLP